MRGYADLMKQLQVPQAGANWSNTATFVQRTLGRIGGRIGMLLGAVVGHTIAPGMPWGLSEAAGAAMAKAAGKVGEISQTRQVARQMPLVADAMRRWQKAVVAANRANSPLSQKTLTLATANLGQALERIGISREAAALQMPSQGRADEQQPQVPRPPGQ